MFVSFFFSVRSSSTEHPLAGELDSGSIYIEKEPRSRGPGDSPNTHIGNVPTMTIRTRRDRIPTKDDEEERGNSNQFYHRFHSNDWWNIFND